MLTLFWVLGYLSNVVAVNIAFAHWPELNWLWSIAVGTVFVTRDYCQRRIGHWVWAPMVVGIAMSYFLATPFVALASAGAFAVSETVDWGVFTATKRPLKDRILWSCAAASPLDSAVFLGLIGFLAPMPFALQVISKIAAGSVVWIAYRIRGGAIT